MGSGFPQINQGDKARGYIHFPELRSSHELQTSTRVEIMRGARWLCRNWGVPRRLRNGITNIVGQLKAQPLTADDQFNKDALRRFEDWAMNPDAFDASGAENFNERQSTLMRRSLEDGDAFVVLAKTRGGLQTALYEAPQVGNARSNDPMAEEVSEKTRWFDGVRMSTTRKREAYCFLDENLRARGKIIPRRDVIHYGMFESPHSPRGMSGFTHAVTNLIDVRELDNSTMGGIKAANLIGLGIRNTDPTGAGMTQRLLERTRTESPYDDESTDDATEGPEVKIEDITQSAGTMIEFGLGKEPFMLHDSRPHPNSREFAAYFIKACSLGFDFPDEVLWHMGKLTGPSTRYIIKAAERAAKPYRAKLQQAYCQRIYAWFIGSEIAAGRLSCSDPRWWVCSWIPPESLTIDYGRDVNAGLTMIERGGGTFSDWYSEANQAWDEQFRQKAVELKLAAKLEEEYGLEKGSLLGKTEPNQQTRGRMT